MANQRDSLSDGTHMHKIVFLKISERSDTVEWLEINKEGLVAGPFKAQSIELMNKFVDSDIVLIVPGQQVLLTQVVLPKLSQSKIKQAVIYAIEEQLSEDVTSLHFSLAKGASKQDVAVAIVNVEKMKAWVSQAYQYTNNNGNLSSVLSETALIPLRDKTWTLWFEEDRVLVRTSQYQGFACDQNTLVDILKLKLNQLSLKPEKLVLYINNEEQVSESLKDINIPIEQFTLDKNALKLQYDEYKKFNYINMLQGQFKPKHDMFTPEVTALIIAGLFGIWFGVLFLGNAVKYVYLNHKVNRIDQQIAENYKILFPNSTSIVSPRIRVQRLLNSMHTTHKKSAFLNLVAIVGPIVKQEKGLVVQMVNYSDSKVELHVDVQDFAILDNFTQRLQRAGLMVSHSNATKAGTAIQAKIELRMAV